MGTEYQKYKVALKKELQSLLGEPAPDDLFEPFANSFIESSRKKLMSRKDYNEQRFESYLNQGAHIAFTPKAILALNQFIISYKGPVEWEKSSKYKRLRELYSAVRFLLLLKKDSGEEFFIESRDKGKGNEPDLTIVHPLYMYSTKYEEFPHFEVMSILEPDVRGFKNGELIEKITSIIEEKKFNMDWGSNTGLLVHFDFTARSSFEELSNRLKKSMKKNPYKSIWVTIWTSENLKDYAGIQVFPFVKALNINRNEKLELLY